VDPICTFPGEPMSRTFFRKSFCVWDGIIATAVPVFFLLFALFSCGNVRQSFIGSFAIVGLMMTIGLSIEAIIETLKNIKGLGKVVAFITNGPEAVCLIVGLAAGDIIYAASTPLGSNLMNPVMGVAAALISGSLASAARTQPFYTITSAAVTLVLAASFFWIIQFGPAMVAGWLVLTVIVSALVFIRAPTEVDIEVEDLEIEKMWLVPALLMLMGGGYYLDDVVTFTAEASRTPKGVIGFFVLSSLTSWPEFKSALVLFRRKRPVDAMLNIIISNVTNLWLAGSGVALWLARQLG